MSDKLKKELRRLFIALALFALVLIIELKTSSEIENYKPGYSIMLMYLIPYFVSGYDVINDCFKGIRNLNFMDETFLMTLATVGAFVIGEYSEAAAVMLFYRIGEWFQSYAVGKSRKSIKELMDIAPEHANIERADGSIEMVDPEEVAVGDILVIRPGEKVPVDGTVLEGEGLINTAALTGESAPRPVRIGDSIISGCINGEHLLRIRAEKVYDESTVAKIIEMVENASSRKSKTENFITRFARYYTPIVVFGALALSIIPSVMWGDPAKWILRACTFLVISCPCALVLSVPLAFFGGIGAASRIGVLVKGSNYLELASLIDTLVTDKTGTLTKGEFKVQHIDCAEEVSPEYVLELAAQAEGLSSHPIAVSIREAYGKSDRLAPLSDVENVSGMGLVAGIEGKKVLVGNEKLMSSHDIEVPVAGNETATLVHVAEDGRYLGRIYVADAVKEGVTEALSELKRQGVRKLVMLTGDRREVGEAVGAGLGIDETYTELMPDGKVRIVEDLLEKIQGGKRVLAFVGDGINDAPVLSRADVGIAMGSMGSDAAIEAADIVIMDDDLRKLPLLRGIAGKTLTISKQNIVFAIGVKILFLILGALGIAGMWWAVFADVGVAIMCILNSMRMLIKMS